MNSTINLFTIGSLFLYAGLLMAIATAQSNNQSRARAASILLVIFILLECLLVISFQ